MPKEGFHLFLAQKLIDLCGGTIPAPVMRERQAFFFGSLSPDLFFYDFPTFSQSALGNSMHCLMERSGIAPIEEWIVHNSKTESAAAPGSGTDRRLAWALGFASHFLADDLWHPVINELSGSLGFCVEQRLSEEDCHRLLESEMEAFWLGRAGMGCFYAPLLNRFREDREWLLEIASYYREFLRFAGLEGAPPEKKILQCCLKQNFLLRLFANPVLRKRRDRLIFFRPARYIGALVVPEGPMLSGRLSGERDLFSEEFMEKRLISLKTRFSELAERLGPFLPS